MVPAVNEGFRKQLNNIIVRTADPASEFSDDTIEAARPGTITAEMRRVAVRENVTPDFIRDYSTRRRTFTDRR
jgi:hypothetical protein